MNRSVGICILLISVLLASLVVFAGDAKLDPYARLAAQVSSVETLAKGQGETEVVSLELLSRWVGIDLSAPEPMMHAVIGIKGGVKELLAAGIRPEAIVGDVVTANLPLRRLDEIARLESVIRIEASRYAELFRLNDISVPETRAPQARSTYGITGKDVIVGIIDTGIDWTHDDFRHPDGTTRIKWLWDMTDATGPAPPEFPGKGTLYSEAQINAALAGTGTVREKDRVGHGSHIAGSSAGNGRGTGNGVPAGQYAGIATEADFVVVKIVDGLSGALETDVINALSWVDQKAAALGMPYVANLSLGGHDSAHDGTAGWERAIDNLVGPGKPGKAIVVACGNDGQNAIHSSGALSASVTSISTQFTIPTYTPNSGAGDDGVQVTMWYPGSANLSVSLRTPGGTVLGPVAKGTSLTPYPFLRSTPDGGVFLDNASNGPDAYNGDNEVTVIVQDLTTTNLKSGTWTFTFSYVSGNSVRFDAWIAGATMPDVAFTTSVDNTRKVTSPGTARNAITVGSYTSRNKWPALDGNTYGFSPAPTVGAASSYSSSGPTRDGRIKPEICAPGEAILSTLSKDMDFSLTWPNAGSSQVTAPDGKHVVMAGTSMATAHVTGAVALLLDLNPNLDAEQLKTMLTATARSDGFTGITPNDQWGYGKMDVAGAAGRVTDVRQAARSEELPRRFALYPNSPNPFNPSTTIRYILGKGSNIRVSLKVLNVLGQEVRTLVDALQEPGEYRVRWDGSDDRGHPMPSGVYLYQLRAGDFTATGKAVLMR